MTSIPNGILSKSSEKGVPEGVWAKCPNCDAVIFVKSGSSSVFVLCIIIY